MFNELNLMITLPKVVNNFLKLRERIEYFDIEKGRLEDSEIKKLFEDIINLRDEIFSTKYDLILNTENDLFEAFDNIHNFLMVDNDHLVTEMENRNLFESSHVLDKKEVEQMYEKNIIESKERREKFFRSNDCK